MPVIIKDFKWSQTDCNISIIVPLHGVHQSKTDIFTSPQYIKVSFEAFFFEVLLLHPINVSASVCTKALTEVVFDLKKVSSGMWESLELNNSRQERNALKQKLILEEHERIRKETEGRIAKKKELKRIAVNEQIKLDTRVRNRIDEIKKQEKAQALGNINEWKDIEESCKSKNEKVKRAISYQNEIDIIQRKPVLLRTKSKTIKSDIPKPRTTRSLQILFTEREFPTPSRESLLEQETEYLRKQAEARRSAGFIDEDLRPEEKNPQYLLSKGREFLKIDNYLGAISALSFGIKLSPKFVDLYIARSEAHLKCGNFKRSVDDCTEALILLKPISPINLDERALCIGRRGIALFKLGFTKQGIAEIKESLKKKNNDELTAILNDLEHEYEQNNKNNDTQKPADVK
ncbi:dynein axonemal assembly factor 4 [Rhynchophorus ferrugineus]|uniref:Dynein axonemal assembly factor 4 n=1 Tax=Rhynchophorus ferrugineus TaxID=354439 RepID=A0A834MJS1_RHYFE|nr:hypothetical protein GWI33_002114 [Rhynchophorus ferrugineus]